MYRFDNNCEIENRKLLGDINLDIIMSCEKQDLWMWDVKYNNYHIYDGASSYSLIYGVPPLGE